MDYYTYDSRASFDPMFIQDSNKMTVNIDGETVSHWFALRNTYITRKAPECSFNLGGKYNTLTFKAYSVRNMALTVGKGFQPVLEAIKIWGEKYIDFMGKK